MPFSGDSEAMDKQPGQQHWRPDELTRRRRSRARKQQFLPVPGVLGMSGRALPAVCLDEALDELVDVPRLG